MTAAACESDLSKRKDDDESACVVGGGWNVQRGKKNERLGGGVWRIRDVQSGLPFLVNPIDSPEMPQTCQRLFQGNKKENPLSGLQFQFAERGCAVESAYVCSLCSYTVGTYSVL